MQAEYFGRKAFGSIQGVVMAVMVIGTMTSPLITGMVYDLHGSYFPAWIVMAVAIFASIFLALQVRPPQKGGRLE